MYGIIGMLWDMTQIKKYIEILVASIYKNEFLGIFYSVRAICSAFAG
jgi:hypothetical protein